MLISRHVKGGHEAEFEQLMASMQAAAALYAGHLGGYLIRPDVGGDPSWHMLFAFDNEANMQQWTRSPERALWLARLAQVTHGDSAARVLSGLETWFALPQAAVRTPPPRWKMACVTWLGIFPLVLLLSHTLTPWLARFLSVVPTTMLVTAAITGAMTWLVMPTLVRVLAGWLYPATRRHESPR